MRHPEGPLTPTQLEVMEVIWSYLPDGATVAEVWESISAQRTVARTTILTLVTRLEARGWLRREQSPGAARFFSATKREQVVGKATGDLIDTYFDGSATALVSNLLGSGRLRRKDVDKLRALLTESKAKKGGRS